MRTTQGHVYFFRAQGQDLFKIGRTSKDPETRRRELSTSCPYDLELIASLRTVDMVEAERIVHAYLKEYRIGNKEWFRVEEHIVFAAIEKFAGMYDMALRDDCCEVVEGKFLALRCSVAENKIDVITEKCPFCGRTHYHGTGSTEYAQQLEYVEGIPTLGHRLAHCLTKPIVLDLPSGIQVNNRDGYYLVPLISSPSYPSPNSNAS